MASSPVPESNYDKNRIMKNTVILYFRMFLTMGVALYTSRVVLNVLGVENFGIYNVVGGVVSMFTFLNAMMSTATQRYLNVEMGRRNYDRLRLVFNTSLTVHLAIALIIFILGETVGLWFVNTQMTIPADRMEAANWVYQFSVITCVLSMTMPPFTATIIAHERMSVYGYFFIIDVSLKLAIVFMLMFISFDKLILYGILTFSVSTLMWILYRVYCHRHFPETHLMIPRDKALFKEMLGFSGWNLFGEISYMLATQGQNLLLNWFVGPIANASRGIAMSVSSALGGFTDNMMISINPQIYKTYASGEEKICFSLVLRAARLSFLLSFVVCIPLIFNMRDILKIWLGTVPTYSEIFCQLVLINSIVQSLSNPYIRLAFATGNIRYYQIVLTCLSILIFPVSYLILFLGFHPSSVFVVTITISVILYFARLIVLRRIAGIHIRDSLKNVVWKCGCYSIVSLAICFTIKNGVNNMNFIVSIILFFIVVSFMGFFLLLEKGERYFIYSKILRRIR